MSELKPCPFCGSKDVGFNENAYAIWVECCNCWCRTDEEFSVDTAREVWNRRADNGEK